MPPNRLDDFTKYKDGIVWNASLVLLNHFKVNFKDYWQGKRVIELGSGLGHLAWGLYELGAHVICTDTPDGDLGALRDRIDARLKEDSASQSLDSIQSKGTIRVEELTWGEKSWSVSPLSTEECNFDVIILAEVFSLPDLHEDLVWTVNKLSHQDVEIWSIFLNRSFSFMFFALLADVGGFRVNQLPHDEIDLLGMEGDELGIFVHHTRYDPQSPRVRKALCAASES